MCELEKLLEIRNQKPKSLLRLADMFGHISNSTDLELNQDSKLHFECTKDIYFPKCTGNIGGWLAFYFESIELDTVYYIVSNDSIYKMVETESIIDFIENLSRKNDEIIDVKIDVVLEYFLTNAKNNYEKSFSYCNPEKFYKHALENNFNLEEHPFIKKGYILEGQDIFDFKRIETEISIQHEWFKQGMNNVNLISRLVYSAQKGKENFFDFVKYNYSDGGNNDIEKTIINSGFRLDIIQNIQNSIINIHEKFYEFTKTDEQWKICPSCERYKHKTAFNEQCSENKICIECRFN